MIEPTQTINAGERLPFSIPVPEPEVVVKPRRERHKKLKAARGVMTLDQAELVEVEDDRKTERKAARLMKRRAAGLERFKRGARGR